MYFMQGASCWHVLGWRGDSDTPVVLCGLPFNPRAYSGGFYEVTHGSLPVCRNCDRTTSGNATATIREYFDGEVKEVLARW